MNTLKSIAGAGALLALFSSGLASAHHSYAMFDREKRVTVTGVVTEWQWTNPHISILMSADPDNKGKPQVYTFEGSSPAVLRGFGWNRTMVKPGDRITVVMFPLRDGSPGGQVTAVTAADGHNYVMILPPVAP